MSKKHSSMQFFTPQFHKFFQALAKNNRREWFHEHKAEYEEHVKEPFKIFISSLILQSQSLDPEIRITPKEAIFRIHRDVRFSKNKLPYKTNVSGVISKYGRKDTLHPGIYVQLGVDGLFIASGAYHPSTEGKAKIRTHISKNLPKFQKILKTKSFKDNWTQLEGEKNKVIPKEFKELAEKEPLIANKAFYVFKRLTDPKIFLDPKLDKLILKQYKAALPLAEFIKNALKATR
jgi:uncharacterized protein (TIGR02453 family)